MWGLLYPRRLKADGIGEELSLGPSVCAGRHDIAVADPVVPAQHAGAELAVG